MPGSWKGFRPFLMPPSPYRLEKITHLGDMCLGLAGDIMPLRWKGLAPARVIGRGKEREGGRWGQHAAPCPPRSRLTARAMEHICQVANPGGHFFYSLLRALRLWVPARASQRHAQGHQRHYQQGQARYAHNIASGTFRSRQESTNIQATVPAQMAASSEYARTISLPPRCCRSPRRPRGYSTVLMARLLCVMHGPCRLGE
jgi:hypothetical protein